MTSQHKYIRTKTGFTIWPDMTTVWHKHMAQLTGEEVISAGFCIFDGENFHCFGRSASLGISSKPGDSEAMETFFNLES